MDILEHFGKDAHGRNGHGHASKSKETLYLIHSEHEKCSEMCV
jgi:hypothetical protein